MASIYSTSSTSSLGIYNSIVSKNKGIGGLVSGLNTDELVEAMVMGTRNKIATQNQQRTLLGWKMSAYRGIASTLRGFQTKFLSYQSDSSTNIKSDAFWNVYNASTKSDKVSVTAGSNASLGSFTIDRITKLASAQTFEVGKGSTPDNDFSVKLDGDTLTLADITQSGAFIGKTLQVNYNGSTKTIKLDALDGNVTSYSDLQTELQKLINNAFGTDSQNNPLINVTVADTVTPGDFFINLDAGVNQVSIRNDVALLGLTSDMTNQFSMATKIGDIDRFSGLIGDNYIFKINDVEFTVTKDTTFSELCTKVTNSTANVKLAYDTTKQTFVFTSKVDGGGDNIRMEDVQGNFMNLFVGTASGNAFYSDATYTKFNQTATNDLTSILTAMQGTSPPLTDAELNAELKKTTFTVTIDGKSVTLNLAISADDFADITSPTPTKTWEEAIEDSLNAQIKSAYGDDIAGKVVFSRDASNFLSLDVDSNLHSVAISSPTSSSAIDALALLGISETSNELISQYGLTVTGQVDYFTYDPTSGSVLSGLYNVAPGQTNTYTMDVIINGERQTIQVHIDDTLVNSLMAGISVGKDVGGVDYANIAALEADLLGLSSPADDDEIARLTALRDKYYDNLGKACLKDLQTQLNTSLEAAFASTPAEDAAGKMSFSIAADGTVTLTSSDPTIAFELTTDPAMTSNLFSALGFSGTVQNDRGTLLSDIYGMTSSGTQTLDIQLDGVSIASPPITYNIATDTVQDVINRINDAAGREIARYENGKFIIDGGTQSLGFTDSGEFMEVFTGRQTYTPDAATGDYTTALNNGRGTNAEIVINGQKLSSTSNTFSYNGVTIEVNELHNVPDIGLGETPETPITSAQEGIVITVGSDPDNVIDNLKGFIEEYNTIVELLNATVKEDKVSGYAPLTDEQKAEMTEKEIEAWEAEAKKGLLRSDSTLRSILDQMRSTMYSKVEAAGLSLYDIGITTMSMYSSAGSYSATNAGKLEISDEDKLRSMLETNPDAVKTLFVNDDEDDYGLAWRLDAVLTAATNESSTSQGSLVRMAGTETITGNNESYLGKRIATIDEYIARLKTRLENEYNRYWQKFSSLETAISRMNNQMSYLDGFGS